MIGNFCFIYLFYLFSFFFCHIAYWRSSSINIAREFSINALVRLQVESVLCTFVFRLIEKPKRAFAQYSIICKSRELCAKIMCVFLKGRCGKHFRLETRPLWPLSFFFLNLFEYGILHSLVWASSDMISSSGETEFYAQIWVDLYVAQTLGPVVSQNMCEVRGIQIHCLGMKQRVKWSWSPLCLFLRNLPGNRWRPVRRNCFCPLPPLLAALQR